MRSQVLQEGKTNIKTETLIDWIGPGADSVKKKEKTVHEQNLSLIVNSKFTFLSSYQKSWNSRLGQRLPCTLVFVASEKPVEQQGFPWETGTGYNMDQQRRILLYQGSASKQIFRPSLSLREERRTRKGPKRHKPWAIPTVTDCRDRCRLLRRFQKINTVADRQDSCRLSRQLQTVADRKDI